MQRLWTFLNLHVTKVPPPDLNVIVCISEHMLKILGGGECRAAGGRGKTEEVLSEVLLIPAQLQKQQLFDFYRGHKLPVGSNNQSLFFLSCV